MLFIQIYLFVITQFKNIFAEQGDMAIILRGMEKITSTTCIRFEQYNPAKHRNYVQVEPQNAGMGCQAIVGRTPLARNGYQFLRLAYEEGCVNEGTVAHEFIHSIGFWHEQQRPDRDDWITIEFQNIPQGEKCSTAAMPFCHQIMCYRQMSQ